MQADAEQVLQLNDPLSAVAARPSPPAATAPMEAGRFDAHTVESRPQRRPATRRRRDWSLLREEHPQRTSALEVRALVDSAKAGNRQAFAELYVRNDALVKRTLRSRLSSFHDLEDATQQVFLHALQALPRFDQERGSFTGWLVTIANNLAHNMRLSAARTDLGHRESRPGDREVRFAVGPDEDLLANERFRQLLARLPRDQRAVLTLRYQFDCAPAEIAALLDRTPDAVAQLHRRALKRARQTAERELAGGC